MTKPLRIAYALTFDPSKHDGIWTRLQERLEHWARRGVRAELVFCIDSTSVLNDVSDVGGHPLHTLRARTAALASNHLRRTIGDISPDVVYMRYNLPYPGMIATARRWPTVLEVHADDKAEWTFLPRRYRLVGQPLRGQLLRHIDGLVLVDPDLSDPALFPVDRVPTSVITNGIRLPALPIRDQRASHSRRQLVLVTGSTAPWQGIEKFTALARLLPQFDFHLVGPAPDILTLPSNVIQRAPMAQADLAAYLRCMDVGVSNLGLELINRRRASPLKVREYIANGLPCITAYDDPDLRGRPDVLPLAFGFAPDESVASAIASFVEDWAGRACTAETRAAVDLAKKEDARLAFLRVVAAQSHK